MSPQEAYKKISKEYTDIIRCIEYSTCYEFQTGDEERLDNSLSVDKKTGEIEIFQPFKIEYQDYLNGKEIKDFKGE